MYKNLTIGVLSFAYILVVGLLIYVILSNPSLNITITEYTIEGKTHVCSDTFCYEDVKPGREEYCFSSGRNQVCFNKAHPFDKEGNITSLQFP